MRYGMLCAMRAGEHYVYNTFCLGYCADVRYYNGRWHGECDERRRLRELRACLCVGDPAHPYYSIAICSSGLYTR